METKHIVYLYCLYLFILYKYGQFQQSIVKFESSVYLLVNLAFKLKLAHHSQSGNHKRHPSLPES